MLQIIHPPLCNAIYRSEESVQVFSSWHQENCKYWMEEMWMCNEMYILNSKYAIRIEREKVMNLNCS